MKIFQYMDIYGLQCSVLTVATKEFMKSWKSHWGFSVLYFTAFLFKLPLFHCCNLSVANGLAEFKRWVLVCCNSELWALA